MKFFCWQSEDIKLPRMFKGAEWILLWKFRRKTWGVFVWSWWMWSRSLWRLFIVCWWLQAVRCIVGDQRVGGLYLSIWSMINDDSQLSDSILAEQTHTYSGVFFRNALLLFFVRFEHFLKGQHDTSDIQLDAFWVCVSCCHALFSKWLHIIVHIWLFSFCCFSIEVLFSVLSRTQFGCRVFSSVCQAWGRMGRSLSQVHLV